MELLNQSCCHYFVLCVSPCLLRLLRCAIFTGQVPVLHSDSCCGILWGNWAKETFWQYLSTNFIKYLLRVFLIWAQNKYDQNKTPCRTKPDYFRYLWLKSFSQGACFCIPWAAQKQGPHKIALHATEADIVLCSLRWQLLLHHSEVSHVRLWGKQDLYVDRSVPDPDVHKYLGKQLARVKPFFPSLQ